MLHVTKIFRFETAHAIHGYHGPCRNIHGHSYELHVTVSAAGRDTAYLDGTGFVADFKDIKKWVKELIVDRFDHRLILSGAFIEANPGVGAAENVDVWPFEPSAENILLYIKNELEAQAPAGMQLEALRLYETSTSYVEWKR